ncbi:hypothetical protein ACHQM5_027040 [Ranunculus cassubicifolius]
MASLQLLILASIFITISLATPLILPITKDPQTLQYLTHIHQGTTRTLTKKLVIDLGGSSLWMDCKTEHSSTSYTHSPFHSLQCLTANANKHGSSFTTLDSCSLVAKNSIAGKTMDTELGEDTIIIQSIAAIDNFLFSCAPSLLLQGLPKGAKGMVGLGRNRISLPSQLTGALGFDRKFSVCLPSSNSDGAIIFNSDSLEEISKSLIYTPLIKTQSDEYYIGVKAIKINGKSLQFDSPTKEAKLSTVVPYTTLETSIYNTVTKAFIEEATMTRVEAIAPFEFCFGLKDVSKTRFGPVVPVIDLVLQSNMVKWRIYGANSMVQVSDEVMCLGLLDGGLNVEDDIVVGGYQLENNLVEFDLAGSRMGFTSLLGRETECSSLSFGREVL